MPESSPDRLCFFPVRKRVNFITSLCQQNLCIAKILYLFRLKSALVMVEVAAQAAAGGEVRGPALGGEVAPECCGASFLH